MAKLSDCLKIHFNDASDQYIIDMIKSRAKELSINGRVSSAIAKKAVQDVIIDFKKDSNDIQVQLDKPMPTYLGASAQGVGTPEQAQEMLDQGKSADNVRKATGWFKGPQDGEWRIRLSDKDFTMTPQLEENKRIENLNTTIGKVFKHDELYKAYPWIKGIALDLIVNPSVTAEDEGSSFRYLGKGKSIISINTYTTQRATEDALHEIQHAIQQVENFASGTSIDADFRTLLTLPEYREYEKAEALMKRAKTEEIAKATLQIDEMPAWREAKAAFDKYNSKEFKDQRYSEFVGEIEARDVADQFKAEKVGKDISKAKPAITKGGVTSYVSYANNTPAQRHITDLDTISGLQKTFGKAPKAASVLSRLKALGVNADDLNLSGIGPYLQGLGNKVVDWDALNEVLEDGSFSIEKTEVPPLNKDGYDYALEDNLADQISAINDEIQVFMTPEIVLRSELIAAYPETEELFRHRDDLQEELEAISAPSYRYEPYSLPGKEPDTYKETLYLYRSPIGMFIEQHWKGQNTSGQYVMAHDRRHDREVEVNGETKSTTHLDELQSRWHDKGRKSGYVTGKDKKLIELEAKADTLRDAFYDLSEQLSRDDYDVDPVDVVYDEVDREIGQELRRIRNEWRDTEDRISLHVNSKVPDAPFKKSWQKMILRDVIAQAVREGKDGISWSTGAIQHERYSHSKTDYAALYDNKVPKLVKELGGKPELVYTYTSEQGDDAQVWYSPLSEQMKKMFVSGKAESTDAIDILMQPIMKQGESKAISNKGAKTDTPHRSDRRPLLSVPKKPKLTEEEADSVSKALADANDESLTDTQQIQKNFSDTVKNHTKAKDTAVATASKMIKGLIKPVEPLNAPVRGKNEQTTNVGTRLFSSPEYYLGRDDTSQKILDFALNEENVKLTMETKLLGDFNTLLKDLRRELSDGAFKNALRIASNYIINTDATGKGFSVKHKKVDKEANGKAFKVTVWQVLNTKDQVINEYTDEKKAVEQVINLEQKALKEAGMEPISRDIVKEARLLTNRGFDAVVADLRRQEALAKEYGTKAPTASYKDSDGKLHRLPLGELALLMGDLRGTYFPRIRQSKQYTLIAENKNGDRVLIPYDAFVPENTERSSAINWVRRLINANTPMGRKAKELEAQGYAYTIKETSTPSESIFDVPGLLSSVDALLNLAEENISSKSETAEVKAIQSIYDQLAQNIADIYKTKGHLTSRKQRATELWEGYETDIERALSGYAQRLAAGEARRTTTRNMLMAFTGRDVSYKDWLKSNPAGTYTEYMAYVKTKRIDPTTQKSLYEDVRTYINFNLRPDSGFDRAVGYLKALTTLKYLGGRVSSAVVNLTAMATSAPATISGHTGIGLAKTSKILTSTADKYMRYRTSLLIKSGLLSKGKDFSSKLGAEDKKIFDYISEQHWDEAKFNNDAAKAVQDTSSRAFNSIMQGAMYMFGATEKANRAMTIFAAYKAINESTKAKFQNMSFEQKMQVAERISSRAHGTYGKPAKPWLVQKIRLLDLPYTFSKYSHNYMLNMIDLGFSQGQIKEALYMLASPVLLAGVGVSPLLAIAKALAWWTDDPEEDFYAYVKDKMGSDTLARHGVIGTVAGVSFKGSLTMNNPIPTKVSEIFGAPGSVLVDIAEAYEQLSYGEYAKAAESLLPAAAGNIIKAKREATEGLTTGSYTPIFFGNEQVKSTGVESAARLLSFSPVRLATIREQQWSDSLVLKKRTQERQDILRIFKRYYSTPVEDRNPGALVAANNDVRLYNERAYRSKPELGVPFITYKWLDTNLHKAFKPTKLEERRRM